MCGLVSVRNGAFLGIIHLIDAGLRPLRLNVSSFALFVSLE